KSREECGHSKSEQDTVLPGTSAKKGTKRKMSAKHKEESSPKKAAEHSDNPKPRKKIPIPPLPSKLPPVNLIHRDIVRAWCQQLKLSSKGQKLDAYRRLCEYAYPNQKVSGPGVFTLLSFFPSPDVRWCVVHGRSLPADTDGWVHLQFHAGQAWVPEKQGGRVSALFLLPACSFPPPHLEDNMLCPTCVHRNKVLVKSLQWE
uniref:Developmental pluripotency associated 4 n=1 Tax=Propithecus coquereli TaxID=379532 RepID=A0A2K6EZY2_PROCO